MQGSESGQHWIGVLRPLYFFAVPIEVVDGLMARFPYIAS